MFYFYHHTKPPYKPTEAKTFRISKEKRHPTKKMSSAADHARRAASLESLLAKQEICAAHVGLAFDAALEKTQTGVRYTRVDPRGEPVFFTAVAFTFPIEIGGQESAESAESARSDPVEMDIQKSVSEIPRQTLEAIALGLAAFADALRLCPGVTGNIGFRPVARFRRDSEGSRVPGVAVTYDQQSDVPTTAFWTIADIAATDRATLADRICAAAPKSAEPGYTTPEKRLRTDDERVEYVRLMSLAPDAKGATTKRTKRALAL